MDFSVFSGVFPVFRKSSHQTIKCASLLGVKTGIGRCLGALFRWLVNFCVVYLTLQMVSVANCVDHVEGLLDDNSPNVQTEDSSRGIVGQCRILVGFHDFSANLI